MSKAMIAGLVLGAVGMATSGAASAYGPDGYGPEYAEVLAVQSVRDDGRASREACRDVAVSQPGQVQDQHQIAGTLIGAVAGGLLGSQIGSGKKLAAVAGAVAGGYAGNKIQETMQARDTRTATEIRCDGAASGYEPVGYDVKYRLGQEVGWVRMDHDPGARIPVRNGRLQLTREESSSLW
ncbi:glycine zipper 2TM domain-containing protein [Azotobacter salinestris]|uniref:glycine zipper 2TM domain-containing protein n=1 Tax=Azotobacter salinestris TaxID=69964 RepID=UPI001266BDDD|nr:glycine zipper 2TM domain-containing protein [Azotobacter salinestris]